jgi:hypothetical protein
VACRCSRRSARTAALSHVSAICRKMRFSRSLRAVFAQCMHSSANSRYSFDDDAAPIRAMNCRISGQLFEARTVKIKRGSREAGAFFLRGHLPSCRTCSAAEKPDGPNSLVQRDTAANLVPRGNVAYLLAALIPRRNGFPQQHSRHRGHGSLFEHGQPFDCPPSRRR